MLSPYRVIDFSNERGLLLSHALNRLLESFPGRKPERHAGGSPQDHDCFRCEHLLSSSLRNILPVALVKMGTATYLAAMSRPLIGDCPRYLRFLPFIVIQFCHKYISALNSHLDILCALLILH